MKTRILALAAATLAAPAAAQPFSQSMAQCAGLYAAMSELISRPDRKAKLDAAAQAFDAAALRQAENEGQDDPEAWVTRHRVSMYDTWAGKGAGAVFGQEFRDWTAYCYKFARNRGIELEFD